MSILTTPISGFPDFTIDQKVYLERYLNSLREDMKIVEGKDHGDLAGLTDDDHTQYLKDVSDDATPTLAGNLTLDGKNITGSGDVSITGSAGLTGDFSADGTITGNIVVDGTFTFAPAAIFNHMGDWSGRAMDTTYTAATDGFVTGFIQTAGATRRLSAYSPITSNRMAQTSTSGGYASAFTFVKKGDTYALRGDVTTYSDSTAAWLPFGSNT